MADINWKALEEIIDAGRKFVLTCHVRPDADALGSALALAGMLEALGKEVQIINPSETPANLAFLDPDGRIRKLGETATVDEALDADVHIVLDTSAWGQLNSLAKVFKKTSARKVVIDHHVSSDDLGAAGFKDTSASATGVLVYRLAAALGWRITPQIATWLFCAVATDTGWFRFASTDGETLRIAAALVDCGVKPALLYELLYEQYTPARVKLAARVLERIALECDGRLAHTWVELKDFQETGARPAETEDLVNEGLRIVGTQAAFIAIEQKNGNVKVSFRSRTELNVSAVAEKFGGGGHRQAAGAMLPGPLAEARRRVLEAMSAALND